MTAAGWIFLIVSCGGVTVLTLWCFWRVLTLPTAAEDIHAPLDIETDERP
jgi:hypothetical protein